MGDSDGLSMNELDRGDDKVLRREVVRCHLPGAETGRKVPCDDNFGTGVGVGPFCALIGP